MSPERILIIKPSAVGDVVHALPVLVALRQRFPAAHIAWLVTPACAGLVQHHPLLNEVVLFDRKHYGRGFKSPRALYDLYTFVKDLRRRQFDTALDLQGLFRSAWVALKCGSKLRIGEASAREGATLFYTHKVNTQAHLHAVDRYLAVASHLGCPVPPTPVFQFASPPQAQQEVDALLSPLAKPNFAVLIPGTNWLTKRWPAQHYQQLAQSIRTQTGLPVVTLGVPSEAHLCKAVQADLNLCGSTPLHLLPNLLSRASVVVANDSGPMHIAAALGVPLVSLFGPTNPALTGPYRRLQSVLRLPLPCSPCLSRSCSHISCLQQLQPQTVMLSVNQALQS